MAEKITLAEADKIAQRLIKKMAKQNDIPKRKYVSESEQSLKLLSSVVKNHDISVTDEERRQPIHVLVQRFQHDALKTLAYLMKNSKSDTVRRQSANDILSLGGNSAKMLEIQAVMTGRSKDISQMSADELEAFISSAKSAIDQKLYLAADNAKNITKAIDENGTNGSPGGGGVGSFNNGSHSASNPDTWL